MSVELRRETPALYIYFWEPSLTAATKVDEMTGKWAQAMEQL